MRSHTSTNRSDSRLSSVIAALALAVVLLFAFSAEAQAQVDRCFAETTGDNVTDFASSNAAAVQDAIDDPTGTGTVKLAGYCQGVTSHAGADQTGYISKSLTLRGGYTFTNWLAVSDPAANPTVLDADGGGRVLLIEEIVSVTVENLSLTNGVDDAGDGAGVLTSPDTTVLISNTLIYQNAAETDGGGIANYGDMAVESSRVYSNTATGVDSVGGGIWNAGSLLVSASHVYTNSTPAGYGGGVSNNSDGAVTIITDSTHIYDNFALDGGGLENEGDGAVLVVENSSVYSNTVEDDGTEYFGFAGGIWNGDDALLLIRNAEIWENTAHIGGGIFNDDFGVMHITDTLIYSNVAWLIPGPDWGGFGGGLSNSGDASISGGEVFNNYATEDGGGVENVWDHGVYSIGTLIVRDNAVIRNNVTEFNDGGGIWSDGFLWVENAVVQENDAGDDGGGIAVYGDTSTISATLIVSNTAYEDGGGIDSDYCDLEIINSAVRANEAMYDGGGLDADGCVYITGSRFYENIAGEDGAGIDTSDSLTIEDSEVYSNTAGFSGGGIYNRDDIFGDLFVGPNVEIRSNVAISDDGGGIFSDTFVGVVDISDSTIQQNSAGDDGGGISAYGFVFITHTQVLSNTAGEDGGGIDHDAAPLVIFNSSIRANHAVTEGGGLDLDAIAEITGTQILGNSAAASGGGIHTAYYLLLDDAQVSNNVSMLDGGGLYNITGTTTIVDSEITGNDASGNGGGIFNAGAITVSSALVLSNTASASGGALHQGSGASTVNNSCIVYNSDTAVNHVSGSTVDATNNWWGSISGPSGAGPGSGDSVSSSVTFNPFLGAAILGCPTLPLPQLGIEKTANDSTPTEGDVITYTIVVSNNGATDATGAVISDLLPSGVTGVVGSAMLDPAGTGVVGMQPHLVSSLRITAGTSVTLTVQVAVDIGTQGQTLTNTAQITSTEVPTAALGSAQIDVALSGPCLATPDDGATVFGTADAHAVQQAVDAAPSAGHVKVAGTCVGVELRDGTLQSSYISKTLTLSGGYTIADWLTSDPVANPTVIDANGGGRVLLITDTVPVEIVALTLQSGQIIGTGGGVSSNGALTVTHVHVLSNTASDDGGGVFAADQVVAVDSLFQNNTSTGGSGGGLHTAFTLGLTNTHFISNTASHRAGGAYGFGLVTVADSRFEKNIAGAGIGGGGGGLYALAITSLTNTHFISNTATGGGGGAYSFAQLTAVNSRFQNNRSTTFVGGGLTVESPASLTNTHFISNTAFQSGGGVHATGAVNVTDSRFENNSSTTDAGGGLTTESTLSLRNTLFLSNTAILRGGGVYAQGAITAENGRFQNNRSTTGGGGGLSADSTLSVTNSHFLSNTAASSGGGLFAGEAITVVNSRFVNNHSTTNGHAGGLATNSSLTMTNTHLLSNTATSTGGGAHAGGVATIADSLFQNNHSTANGGGGLSAFSTLIVTNTHFLSNTATDGAGGVFASEAMTVVNSRFENNASPGPGGGLVTPTTLHLINSIFLSNRTGQDGGGAVVGQLSGGASRIVNSLFARNHAGNGAGSALHLILPSTGSGTVEVIFTTVTSPTLASGSAIEVGNGSVAITDTIVASHTVGIQQTGGTVTEDYNLFFGNWADTAGAVGGGGNSVGGAPAFLDPASDDYHLTASSAAINIGVDVGVYVDFEGDPRPQVGGFDAGYDESPYSMITPVLSLDKSVNDDNPESNDTITYTVVISNGGTGPATGGVISDVIPTGLTYVGGSATLDPAGAGTLGAPPQLVTGLTITAGTSVTLTFQATVNGGLTTGLTITNTASVTATNFVTPTTGSVTLTVDSPEVEDITVELDLVGMAITNFESGGGGYGAGILDWVWTILNPGAAPVSNIYFDIVQLDPTIAVVINADGGPAGAGGRVSVPNNALGPDQQLTPGETYAQLFEIGWLSYTGFTFQVQAFGVVGGSPLVPAEPQILGTYTVEFDRSVVDELRPEADQPNKIFLPLINR